MTIAIAIVGGLAILCLMIVILAPDEDLDFIMIPLGALLTIALLVLALVK